MRHLSTEDLEALVLGESPAPDDPRLIHLAGCPLCARLLAREARVHMALHAAVESGGLARVTAPPSAVLMPAWRYVIAAAAMMAVVIAGVLLLRPHPRIPATSSAAVPRPALLADTPCLVDPLSLGPGSDVVAPTVLGRDLQASPPTETFN